MRGFAFLLFFCGLSFSKAVFPWPVPEFSWPFSIYQIDSSKSHCSFVFESESSLRPEKIDQFPFGLIINRDNLDQVITHLKNADSPEWNKRVERIFRISDSDKKPDSRLARSIDGSETERFYELQEKTPMELFLETSSKSDDQLKNKILGSIRRISDGKTISTEDMENLRKLLELQRELLNTNRTLEAELGVPGITKKKIYESLLRNKEPFEAAIRNIGDGKTFLLTLPIYDSVNQRWFLEPTEIKTVTRFRQILAGYKDMGYKVNELDRRLDEYAHDYMTLMFLRERLLRIPESTWRFSSKTNPTEEDLSSHESVRKELKDIRQELNVNLGPRSSVHPSFKQIKRARADIVQKALRRKAWKKVIAILGGAGIAGALINQPDYFYDKGVSVVNFFRDRANLNNDEYWIKKCSSEENLPKMKSCLERFRFLLINQIDDKIKEKREALQKEAEEKNRLYDENSFDDTLDKILFKKRIDNVCNGVLANGSFRIFADTYAEMSLTYKVQEVYNIGKTLSQKTEDDKKAKEESKKKGEEPLPSSHPIEVFQARIMQETEGLHKTLRANKDNPIEKTVVLVQYLAKMDAIERVLTESKELKADPKLKEVLEQISRKIDEVPVPSLQTPAAPTTPPAPSNEQNKTAPQPN